MPSFSLLQIQYNKSQIFIHFIQFFLQLYFIIFNYSHQCCYKFPNFSPIIIYYLLFQITIISLLLYFTYINLKLWDKRKEYDNTQKQQYDKMTKQENNKAIK